MVEVAVSSQMLDRDKAASYARAGVAVYWILDLVERRLEVRTDPRPDGGCGVTTVLHGRESVTFPGIERTVCVSSLLP